MKKRLFNLIAAASCLSMPLSGQCAAQSDPAAMPGMGKAVAAKPAVPRQPVLPMQAKGHASVKGGGGKTGVGLNNKPKDAMLIFCNPPSC
jgi:hypothetical protein